MDKKLIFERFKLPADAEEVLTCSPNVILARSVEHLNQLAVAQVAEDGYHHVAYEVPGRGLVEEVRVCQVKNGIAANYVEPYMRRRDPECMVIGDDEPTDKPTFLKRFGQRFDGLRKETLEWLKTQELACFAFTAGMPGKGTDAMVIAPANAGFFALGLAMLQGLVPPDELPADFAPRAIIYVAPPFRHTHLDGKQVVVHNRQPGMHELFSYNLYPGPSAKKGVYGVLLALGEKEDWLTMHCSAAQVVTPYDNRIGISHEGASGGGKSEMLEMPHRLEDGRLQLGRNLVTGEVRKLTIAQCCQVRPVADDMALCHPSLNKGHGKLTLTDAEDAWFVRVNHIEQYGADPHLERMTIHPRKPLLFLNIDAKPGATALIWEHTQDEPGVPCPNPRVIIPADTVPDAHRGNLDVDIRSFGVRCPPTTRDNPTYGILGLFHLLPPALAWIWRLVAPRGHANPSIVNTQGMSSEGVGSYWPFATGRRVDQANLILKQILDTPRVKYILVPNQHIGAWAVSFMPQWITRDYMARRGGARFSRDQVSACRCPLLGWNPNSIAIEGRNVGVEFFKVEKQLEVGEEAYDQGAAILRDFFVREVTQFKVPDLLPLGREIIDCCLERGGVEDYAALIPHETISGED
ncbi:MAG: DUF4914 family protein [Candidatus Marinimicrobia bacterium]|nr:DUF4914 family protein [Candidatus Neomarinimicrobiota bacterium]